MDEKIQWLAFFASEFCSASASAIRRWLALTITRSQGQKPACKDFGRNGQERAITPKATYTPVSKRPCSRSLYFRRKQRMMIKKWLPL
ncbi:hypothetical protein AAULR_04971 [Lacticaseibacillus rhamnosus MTCC 5462]|nr:hypothetical protein AAULR_04971 [Lacticaseibacillus rhamnosus MTCC 5462]